MTTQSNTLDVKAGDWIKYRSGHYRSGRLAEAHALGADAHSGPRPVSCLMDGMENGQAPKFDAVSALK